MARKTLISIIQTVCAELNLPQPVVVISNTDQNVVKLVSLAIAVCDDLVDEHDWQVLQTRTTLTTVNAQQAYDFPADYQRFVEGSWFQNAVRWSINGSLTPTQWGNLQVNSTITPYTNIRIYGDQIHLYPTPAASGQVINYEYISNYYVEDATTGLTKATFTADADLCLFDHRLVVYGIKLKWLESLQMDTTSASDSFNRVLETQKASDTPAPRLSLGGNGGFRLLSDANIPDYSWDQ